MHRRVSLCGLHSPQRSYSACLEKEGRPLLKRFAGPSLRKGPQDVAVGNDQDIPAVTPFLVLGLAQDRGLPLIANLLDQAIQALGDLRWTPKLS